MSNQDGRIGVIHEVGDFGLGFNPITESEQKELEKKEKEEK